MKLRCALVAAALAAQTLLVAPAPAALDLGIPVKGVSWVRLHPGQTADGQTALKQIPVGLSTAGGTGTKTKRLAGAFAPWDPAKRTLVASAWLPEDFGPLSWHGLFALRDVKLPD